MSNQTFIKKDKISFAVDLNDILSIAPINNNTSIYFGPSNINSNNGVVLSNQYIYADGTYLSNLPNGISQSDITSTTIGLGNLGYVSSLQLQSTVVGLGNIYVSTAGGGVNQSQLVSTVEGLGNIYVSTVGGGITQHQLLSTTTGLGNIYVSSFDTISSLNISTGRLFSGVLSSFQVGACTINANLVFTSNLFGPFGGIYTQNLYPRTQNAVIGYGTTLADGGFYNEGHFNSTFTAVIQPRLEAGGFSNIVRIQGFTSTQQIFTSSIFARANISTQNTITSNIFVTKIQPYNATRVEANYIHSEGTVANSAIGSLTRFYNEGYFSNIANLALVTSSIQSSTIQSINFVSTNEVRTQFLRGAGTFGDLVYTTTLLPQTNNVSLIGNGPVNSFGQIVGQTIRCFTIENQFGNNIVSTVRILGTLSSQNAVISSLVISNAVVQNLSSFFYGGIEKYNYISTTGLQSTVIGLVDHLELNSSITGLGTIGYISTLSLQSTVTGLIESPEVQSTVVGLGSANYISSSQLFSTTQGLGQIYLSTNSIPSTIDGLGTFGYISSLSLQSTIQGLGTFAYVSTQSLISSTSNWSYFKATNNLDMNLKTISNVTSLEVDTINKIPLNTELFIDSLTNFLGNSIQNIDTVTTNTINTSYISSLVSTITVEKTLVPSLDNTYDLGASTNTWRHVFMGGGSLYMKNDTNNLAINYNSLNQLVVNRPINISFSNDLSVEPKLIFTDSNSDILSLYPSTIVTIGLTETTLESDRSLNLKNNYILGLASLYFNDNINNSNYGIGPFPGSNVLCYFRSDNVFDNLTPLRAIAQDWSLFGAETTLVINSNTISNVKQDNIINNGATNAIGRRIYFDTPADFSVNSSTYYNVLTTSVGSPPSLFRPFNYFSYYNCTFSFRCDGIQDSLAYYFRLSNLTTPAISSDGELFNSLYPYIENSNAILLSNHSIVIQDQFNISSWNEGDHFIPMMFIKTDTVNGTLSNMKFSMVYEPLLP